MSSFIPFLASVIPNGNSKEVNPTTNSTVVLDDNAICSNTSESTAGFFTTSKDAAYDFFSSYSKGMATLFSGNSTAGSKNITAPVESKNITAPVESKSYTSSLFETISQLFSASTAKISDLATSLFKSSNSQSNEDICKVIPNPKAFFETRCTTFGNETLVEDKPMTPVKNAAGIFSALNMDLFIYLSLASIVVFLFCYAIYYLKLKEMLDLRRYKKSLENERSRIAEQRQNKENELAI